MRLSAPRGRLATVAAAIVVTLALAGTVGWFVTHRPRPGPGHPVVAVLPLETVGGAPDDHLGIGMADTLIAHLAGIPSLTVVSRDRRRRRTATRRGQVRRLAHELGADYVVSGSILRLDRRMHVTATLVRPDDSVAWGADYEGSVDDLFSLQRRLAEGVSAALAVSLTPADRARLARPPTSSLSALAAYSEARRPCSSIPKFPATCRVRSRDCGWPSPATRSSRSPTPRWVAPTGSSTWKRRTRAGCASPPIPSPRPCASTPRIRGRAWPWPRSTPAPAAPTPRSRSSTGSWRRSRRTMTRTGSSATSWPRRAGGKRPSPSFAPRSTCGRSSATT